MKSLTELESAVRRGLEAAANAPGVVEAEVFASENTSWIGRINYTSHIPSNGIEEPKSITGYGVGVRAVFKDSGGANLTGFGSESSDLSTEGILSALEKARTQAVVDPHFHGLPEPSTDRSSIAAEENENLDALADDAFVGLAWSAVKGGVDVFASSGVFNTVIIGGDILLSSERMAVANSKGVSASDQSSLLSAMVTAMVERDRAKGTGWTASNDLASFHPEEAGAEAARAALASRGGKRIATGRYAVIFGPQAVAELLHHLIVPSLTLSAFDEVNSPFLGQWGKTIADENLLIYDEGNLNGAPGNKRTTCEGIPAGKTPLIERGRLAGLLSDWYTARKCLADPGFAKKLGGAMESAVFQCRNGFRSGPGGGRLFNRKPSISATNLFIRSSNPMEKEKLIAMIPEGLYIGRLWYTYPVNGLAAGDFTSTIVGDSYVIRDGAIASPLAPNTTRIDDNFASLLTRVIGLTDGHRPTIPWAADEVMFVPEMAVRDVPVSAIAAAAGQDAAGGLPR